MVNIQNVLYIRADKTCLNFSPQQFLDWQASILLTDDIKARHIRYHALLDKTESLLERRHALAPGALKNLRLIYPNVVLAKEELEKPENFKLVSDPETIFTIQIRAAAPTTAVVTAFCGLEIQTFNVPWTTVPLTLPPSETTGYSRVN